jgi:hypothetical protein
MAFFVGMPMIMTVWQRIKISCFIIFFIDICLRWHLQIPDMTCVSLGNPEEGHQQKQSKIST